MSGYVRDTGMIFVRVNKCEFYMLVTCRKSFRLNHVSSLSTMVFLVQVVQCRPLPKLALQTRGPRAEPEARNEDENGCKIDLNFGLTWKMGKKWAGKWEKWLKNPCLSHSRAIFPIFQSFFPHFPGEAKNHFSAIFVPIAGFRPSGPKWICTRSEP